MGDTQGRHLLKEHCGNRLTILDLAYDDLRCKSSDLYRGVGELF